MNRMQGNGSTAIEELRGVVNKAEELLASLSDETDEVSAELKDRVNGTIRTARDRLTELDANARDAAERAADTADEYVTSHPWAAVAVAATVGAIAGAVLSRRV